MAAKLLPPLPWRLAGGYKKRRLWGGVGLLVLGSLLVGLISWWQVGEMLLILDNERVWNDPRSARSPAEVRGRDSSQMFLHTYTLDVSFDGPKGIVSRKLEFGTVGGIDRDAEPEVRFDPGDPSRFALNWAVEASGGRWASAILLFVLLNGIFGATCFGLGVVTLRQYVRALGIEQRGVELHCELLSAEQQVVQGKPTHRVQYRVLAPSKSEDPESPFATKQAGSFMLSMKDGKPLVVDGRYVVLVRAEDTTLGTPAVGLREDRYPVVSS